MLGSAKEIVFLELIAFDLGVLGLVMLAIYIPNHEITWTRSIGGIVGGIGLQ